MCIVTSISQLRQVSEPASSIEEANEIINQLERELRKSDGVGLAAPQIGIFKRVAIVRVNGNSVNIINPKDMTKSKDKYINIEGCLSIPQVWKPVVRYSSIDFLNAFDLESGFFSLDMHGRLMTSAVQHEIDHLDGILLLDREFKKVERNELCPCGSGKKFKKCCMEAIPFKN
jgi:peptide deformylase